MANHAAVVRQWNSNGVASGALTVATNHNVLSGTTLFLCSLSLVTTEAITGITDSVGSTYTELFDSTVSAFRFEVWRATSAGAGANTLTVTYSATTGARRVWAVEVGDLGTYTLGPTDTHDQTSAEDPMTLASVTGIAECGIAFLLIGTDTASSPEASPMRDTGAGDQGWVAMGAGGSSQGYFKAIGPSQSALTPQAAYNATETGESALVCVLAEAPAGGGSTEAAYPFVGGF